MTKTLERNIAGERKDLALSIHGEIMGLFENTSKNFIAIGERLTRVHDQSLYQEIGFDTFEEYCDQKLDFQWRKAYYLIDGAKASKIMKDVGIKPEEILKVGWTKICEAAPVITRDNAKEWLKKCQEETMEDLRLDIKKDRAKAKGKTVEELEAEEELFKLVFQFYKPQLETVQRAMHVAGKILKSEKPSHILEMICLAYTSHNLANDADKSLTPLLEAIERCFGVQVTATRGDKSVFGKNGKKKE